MSGLVVTFNIIITTIIYYLFLFIRSFIYLIVYVDVCVCLRGLINNYTVSV